MIPDMLAEVKRCQAKNTVAWLNAHTGNAFTEDFIRLLAADLHAIDPRFGLNGKRGNPLDISDDAINYLGEGPGHDPLTGQPVTVFDVIRGAGGPTPEPSWDRIDLPGPGAWVKPGAAVPPAPPAPTYPGYPTNEGILDATGTALFADFAEAGQAPNPQMFRFAFRVAYDWLVGNVPSLEASTAKHRKEWRALLGLPPR